MTKRKILKIILVLIAVYIAWLGFQLAIFKSYNTVPIKDPSFEVTGVFHIHSTCSDGKRSVAQIAGYAADRSLDFIVITDHGNPNYESLQNEGWREGVLVLCGSELSENRGHLVAVGFTPPSSPFRTTQRKRFTRFALWAVLQSSPILIRRCSGAGGPLRITGGSRS